MTYGLHSLIKLKIVGKGSKGDTVLSGSWANKASKKPKKEHSDFFEHQCTREWNTNHTVKGWFFQDSFIKKQKIVTSRSFVHTLPIVSDLTISQTLYPINKIT